MKGKTIFRGGPGGIFIFLATPSKFSVLHLKSHHLDFSLLDVLPSSAYSVVCSSSSPPHSFSFLHLCQHVYPMFQLSFCLLSYQNPPHSTSSIQPSGVSPAYVSPSPCYFVPSSQAPVSTGWVSAYACACFSFLCAVSHSVERPSQCSEQQQSAGSGHICWRIITCPFRSSSRLLGSPCVENPESFSACLWRCHVTSLNPQFHKLRVRGLITKVLSSKKSM